MRSQRDHVHTHQKYMSYFVAAHIPLYTAANLALGIPFIIPAILQIILTAVAFAGLYMFKKNRDVSIDLSAVSIVLTPSVLVYMLQGQVWQLDAHMYFFATLAMVIGFKSMRAAIMATLAIALHHISMNFVLPYAVFPDGADFLRVVFHAVIVIVESAVILITIRSIVANDKAIMDESTAAQDALETANEARALQKESERRAETERANTMNDIAQDFDKKIGGLIAALSESSTELQSTAQAMRNVAEKTSNDSETVSSSSSEASLNVSTVAAAMEEMSASASEISTQMSSVKNKSEDTEKNARIASDVVNNLNQLAENIGEVVVSIQGIAEQTNLLALNATIEAARSGEAGKGFAVVADEVKKLATETSQKTEEIDNRIHEIQNATKSSVDAMQHIISNIEEINSSVTGVSSAVAEQNATTSEIVRSVSIASQGVERVSQIITDVKQGAEQTGSSSDTVLTAANKVASLSENLQGSVNAFLLQIKSDQE